VRIVAISAVEIFARSDDKGLNQVSCLREMGFNTKIREWNRRTSQTMTRSPGATCLAVDHINGTEGKSLIKVRFSPTLGSLATTHD
jgi:hypothetical protein